MQEWSWRDDAMSDALLFPGNAPGRLTYWLRHHYSGSTVAKLNSNVTATLRFLREEADDLTSLLTGSGMLCGTRSGRAWIDFGWYAAEWKGCTIEVVVTPHRGGYTLNADLICASWDKDTLARFVESLHDYSTRVEGRCLRYGGGAWESAPDIEEEVGAISWDDLVLPPETLAGIRESVEGFFANRAAYASWGFAWRRGILLVGPPGTGKTMVCKAVAAALPDLPFLYVRETRGYDREPIGEIFTRARRLAPCVLAFEDVDGMVGQHNRTVFLNELDGFASNDGLLVIASSNHPGKIDEALLKRPSCFDRIFHLGLPALGERKEYCRRLLSRETLAGKLSRCLDPHDLAERVAAATEGFTPAYLKEVFVSAALRRAHEGAVILDDAFADAALESVAELRSYIERAKDPGTLAEMRASSSRAFGFR